MRLLQTIYCILLIMLEAVYFFLKYIKAVFYINYFSKPLQ